MSRPARLDTLENGENKDKYVENRNKNRQMIGK